MVEKIFLSSDERLFRISEKTLDISVCRFILRVYPSHSGSKGEGIY